MNDTPDDKKEKKKLQRLKHRKQFIISQHLAAHEANLKLAKEQEEAMHEAAREPVKDANGDVVWSAKTQKIRNRINGKQRMAKDRWNRFAGTSDAGGMGR